MGYLKFCQQCHDNNEKMFHGYYGWLKDDCYECPMKACKSTLVDTSITKEEYKIIDSISQNVSFLEAMIHLKETDIIEYELKMAQFRNQMAQSKEINSQKSNVPKCPTCGSTDIEKISAGKKAKGNFFFGFLSSDVRNTMHCKNCGYKW